MVSILSLFTKSPFGPIQKHMQVVMRCVDALKELLKDQTENGGNRLDEFVDKVSDLEHEADIVKNDIRDNLPTSIFMPVDRRDLLEVVTQIDAIADVAEDTARLIHMRNMAFPAEWKEHFDRFTKAVFRSAELAGAIVAELDQLLASSFVGAEAKKVLAMIQELGQEEHESDIAGEQLLKELFKMEDQLKPLDAIWWLKIFAKIADIANMSEKMANRLRLFMSK